MWKLVSRRPVAPQTVAVVRISGVGGSMDVSCSVIVEVEECRLMGMLWPRCADGANNG